MGTVNIFLVEVVNFGPLAILLPMSFEGMGSCAAHSDFAMRVPANDNAFLLCSPVRPKETSAKPYALKAMFVLRNVIAKSQLVGTRIVLPITT